MARIKAVAPEDRLTLVEHLDELRTRIIVSLAVFGVALALCFWQNHLLLKIANEPLPDNFTPITLSPTEPFLTTFTICAYGAIILSLPILLYQAYAYVLPAFSHQERRVILPLLLMVPFLFLARRRLRLLRRPPGGRPLPAQLQQQRVHHPAAGPRLLQLLRHHPARLRHRLPGAGGDPRA